MITTKEVAPHSYTYFDVSVENFGYYRDMFQLEFINNKDVRVAASDQLFVLDPNDSQNIRISVLTPEKLFDLGTPNTIEVYATSSSDPNPILIGTIVVITKGIYISPLIVIVSAPIIIFIILIFLIIFYRKQKREQELIAKPEKPWEIPEEIHHLEELKRKDKDAYEKERLMMEDEYQSAMLWYNDYRQSFGKNSYVNTSNRFNSKINNFFKKPEKKTEQLEKKQPEKKKEVKTIEKKEKPIKKQEKPKQKEEKPRETPEIVKEQYKSIQKRSSESERRKQIALEKIKRAQEKQKKKIKK